MADVESKLRQVYVDDEKMLKLGTAAVHLVTMATSRTMARSKIDAMGDGSES